MERDVTPAAPSHKTVLNRFVRQSLTKGSKILLTYLPTNLLTKKIAFTLAEVLITLGIIGVVAALLIPGINDQIERHRNAVVLKRAYADLQNYLKMFDYENNCGQDFHTCFPGENELKAKFVTYLIEKQKFRSLNQNASGYNHINAPYKYGWNYSCYALDSASLLRAHASHCLISPTGEYAYFIVALVHDNTYDFSYANNEYYRAIISIVTDARKLKVCKWLCRDQNDYPKAKIDEGRNVFQALLTDKRVFPNGSAIGAGGSPYYWKPLSSDTCSKGNDKFSTCFQKVIDDGWQIKYPY